ncbi:hypothetical protein ATANTOWER_004734 [Ataeniobius toweri]|uniref:Uncharacterized protein n=1 Tax=Ataeniobius toweri TaxID=208326 RepID=A0ABU7B1D6_9TELE|nr:hypothetical protein [Ataeniobius toweri]
MSICHQRDISPLCPSVQFRWGPAWKSMMGVFHNQVLRCASRTLCPQGLSGEGASPPPDAARQQDGIATAA